MFKRDINNLSLPLSGSSHPLKGIIYMLVAGLLLTTNDGIMKWLTGGYPTGQIMFVRGVFMVIPVYFFIWWAGGIRRMRIVSLKGQFYRATFVVIGTFCFVAGLAYLPLADAIAITFAGPLFVTAMASLFLKEIVGWRRWAAVFLGFMGVIVIIRPTGDAIQWAALLPLTASFTGALRDIITRYIAGGEQSATILTVSTTAVCLAGLATLPFGWQPIVLSDLLLFLISGLLIGGAHFLMIDSFRYAEAALVTPFKYASIIWAAALGFFVWGDLPDQWTVIGSMIVIASGFYILSHKTNKGGDQ
jgi:drug/metabolite transporter (DMT)-like permease